MSNSQSREDRRQRRAVEVNLREAALRAEHDRRNALNMWERIEELDASGDMKEILHDIAAKVGID